MLALLLLITAAVLNAATLAPAKRAEIERVITEEMSRQSIPAVSVAVAVDGEMLWSAGMGMADVENFVPAKASTMYRLGSISKPITAVAAMQLAESGKLDPDATVDRYVPSFPRKRWPITIRHLLSHQSGIRHYTSADEVNSTRHYVDLLEPLKIFQADPLVAEPGTTYHYTTYGYVLLGAAIEAASKTRFMDYLRQHVFQPAGMNQIRADHVHAIIPNRARGYAMVNGQLRNCSLADTSNKIPGGGLTSTVEDLVRFALAMEQGKLVKPATREAMFRRQRLRDGKVTSYGLGWRIDMAGQRKVVGHTGGQQGVSTILQMVPKDHTIVALMCNREQGELRTLAARILRLLRD
jgi:CubicO group peptidase (beta-lactamase class C family)